jgi:parallel beta-helix repeat protein
MAAPQRFRTSISVAFVAALVTASGLATAVAARADAIDCGSAVSASVVLQQDVLCPSGWTGDGLRVAGSGVTLDLNGHVVTGPGAAGIRVLGTANTVTNTSTLPATVSGFAEGVVFDQATNSVVHGLRVTVNGRGIDVAGADGNTVSGNVVSGNAQDGIRAGASTGNTISGNTVSKNVYGIGLADGSSDNTVTGNTVSKNRNFGIAVFCGSDGNTVSGNAVTKTAGGEGHGIIVRSGSDDTLVQGNGANQNAADGIHVDTAGSCANSGDDVAPIGTRLVGNSANGNGADGIDASVPSTITSNTANNDAEWGIWAPTSCDGGGNVAKNDGAGPTTFAC